MGFKSANLEILRRDSISDKYTIQVNCIKVKLKNPGKKVNIFVGINQELECKRLTDLILNPCFSVMRLILIYLLLHFSVPAICQENADTAIVFKEILPVYPGGSRAMMDKINNNFSYPKAALKDNIKGIIILYFTIDSSGWVKDIEVVKGLREDLDNEAIRVVSLLERFTPGYQNGSAVPVKMTIPIKARINGNYMNDELLNEEWFKIISFKSLRKNIAGLDSTKGAIYGSFIQRLGFSSGGYEQSVYLRKIETGKIYRFVVKPTWRGSKENFFSKTVTPGKYEILFYEYAGGVTFSREEVWNHHNGKRYTFEVKPNELTYVGTWDFSSYFVYFRSAKEAAMGKLQKKHKNTNRKNITITIPQ